MSQNTNSTTKSTSNSRTRGGKRSQGYDSRRPPTTRDKFVPMDRNPKEGGAPPLVKGTRGAFLNKIHQVSGCTGRFLSAREQRNYTPEVNLADGRIVRFEIDPEVEMPDTNFGWRLNKACQMTASAIQHWRHLKFPPDVDEEEPPHYKQHHRRQQHHEEEAEQHHDEEEEQHHEEAEQHHEQEDEHPRENN